MAKVVRGSKRTQQAASRGDAHEVAQALSRAEQQLASLVQQLGGRGEKPGATAPMPPDGADPKLARKMALKHAAERAAAKRAADAPGASAAGHSSRQPPRKSAPKAAKAPAKRPRR